MATYRWFDAKGLASMAKTALKEAQKQIDKALDIQEEGAPGGAATPPTTSAETPTPLDKQQQQQQQQHEAGADVRDAAKWGSFTGSFFDNPNANEMVTIPPKASATPQLLAGTPPPQPSEVAPSSSGSVELLTPPSVSSDTLSAYDASTIQSESIELLTAEGAKEAEGQSEVDAPDVATPCTAKDADDSEGGAVSLVNLSLSNFESPEADAVSPAPPLDHSMEVVHFDSDSTQSFEELQMQSDSAKASQKSGAAESLSSPHNSTDEVETTTSSDIEVISHANGDSSGASPHKKASGGGPPTMGSTAKKGHCREPSEVSILSEESQSAEVDKLLQLLEARTVQLLDFEQQNVALHERNKELHDMLDAVKGQGGANLDSAEQYTQQLCALERKFQFSIRERDALRVEIKRLTEEQLHQVPKQNLTQVVAENNAIIAELRQEGDKLAKEILQQSNIIKKLRAKEKTSDATLRRNEDEIASLLDDTDRLKRTLNAKEDVERSQIEAISRISAENQKLSEENATLRSQEEDLRTKLEALQSSLDGVRSELQERQRLQTNLTRTQAAADSAKAEVTQTQSENRTLHMQVEELREKLRLAERTFVESEAKLRAEKRDLLQRLESAELRMENSTQEASLTTIPLMRQMEALQNTLSQRTSAWNRDEKLLMQKLAAAESRLHSLEDIEDRCKNEADAQRLRLAEMEEKLAHSLLEAEQLRVALRQAELDFNMRQSQLVRQVEALEGRLEERTSACEALTAQQQVLEAQLKTQAAAAIAPTATLSVDNLRRRDLLVETMNESVQTMAEQTHTSSPVASYGVNSLEEALGGTIDWLGEDGDIGSNSVGHGTLHYSLVGHTTSTLEHLQSLLKQRDGELSHLQWESARLQSERAALNDEISSLTLELETVKEQLRTYESLAETHAELQNRYDALLQMYGEKVERTQELELDLQECKEAYKLQIDELLALPRAS